MKVKKIDLIKKIQDKNPDLTLEQVNRILKSIFEEITLIMLNGDSYNQVNFGHFTTKKRNPKIARNLETKEPIQLNSYIGPKFIASKSLKQKLKGKKN